MPLHKAEPKKTSRPDGSHQTNETLGIHRSGFFLNATERVNHTLKTAIHAHVEDKHTSWDKHLPQICFALRPACQESTGQSPAMLLYGRELELLDLITQPNPAGVDDPEVPYPESLRASLQNTLEHARADLSASHTRKKRYCDKKR